MKRYFEVQLSCGNIQVIPDVWENTHAICSVHNMPDAIVAIETREWHVKCTKCRYGRWCGNSIGDARITERKHLVSKPGHTMQYAFITPDEIRERWRNVFGRKRTPRRYINPNERISAHHQSASSAIAAAAKAKRDAENTTDIPPF